MHMLRLKKKRPREKFFKLGAVTMTSYLTVTLFLLLPLQFGTNFTKKKRKEKEEAINKNYSTRIF